MDFYQQALMLCPQTQAHRRFFHQNAEVGLNMPEAVAYVTRELKSLGLDPRSCGHGVTATIGSGRPCILLRADMDALPMAEESGEPFACPTKTAAHTCGHDLHAAMLLTAAAMLCRQQETLQGTVKLMFQSAEETFQGAEDMLEAGILRDPPVDAALSFHVAAGKMPPGLILYNAEGTMMASADNFRITIHGKSSHGAYPQEAISPIRIAAHLCMALDTLVAEETDPKKMCILSLGQIHSGTAANIIPDLGVIEGTLRTDDENCRQYLLKRIRELAREAARHYGGSSEFTILSGVPPLVCHPELTQQMAGFIRELRFPGAGLHAGITANASEDFARIAAAVPSSFFYLSAGFADERGNYPAHNPKVRFCEDVLPIGAACYAQCAVRWLTAQATK